MDTLGLYYKLSERYGEQSWWPIYLPPENSAKVPLLKIENGLSYGIPYTKQKHFATPFRDPYFEIAIGAILTQNTAWRNVAMAIQALYQANCLTPKLMFTTPQEKLQELIYSAGYFRQKAKKLHIFSEWLIHEVNGDISLLRSRNLDTLRNQLLSIWGIGNETADSILLYALNRPIWMVDAYTVRFCKAHGQDLGDYAQHQEFFMYHLPKNATLFQEYHALIVAWGQDKHRPIWK